MKVNPFIFFLVIVSLFQSSCLDSVFVTIVPEEFCDDIFVDCGPNGTTSYFVGPGYAFCACVCESDSELFENNIVNIKGGGLMATCICNKDIPCENVLEVRVLDDKCQCRLKILSADDPSSPLLKNLSLEMDYFPLQLNQSFLYDFLNNEGDPNGQFGYVIIDTTFVYLLHDSTQLAVPTTLYHQGILVFDSTGMLTDTILGGSLHNLPEDPNLVAFRATANDGVLGVHQAIFRDSIGNEMDGYLYFDSLGTVIVPAGTFENCLLLTDDHINGYVYAPNVGLIKIIAEGMDAMLLTEFNGESADQECEDILNITDPITDNAELKASDHIIISSEVQGNYQLTLQAANYIQMNPGLSIPAGSVLIAVIAACEDLFSDIRKGEKMQKKLMQ